MQRKITNGLQNSGLTQDIVTDSVLFVSLNSSPDNKEQQYDITTI